MAAIILTSDMSLFSSPSHGFLPSKCWQPATPTATAVLSPNNASRGSSCGSSDLSRTAPQLLWQNVVRCGVSVRHPVPRTDGECYPGEHCFANTPCDGSNWPQILPPPPSSSLFQYCGSSMADASGDCWQPCQEFDCCFGLKCFDTSSGKSSGRCSANSDLDGANRYFCGSSWCDAAYSCGVACPGGQMPSVPERILLRRCALRRK
ncbi:hypothetical protein ACHAW5_010505 [Stephanodiscus triporus]|uniref:Uncharacterized protein n=1 Tax=Stephanodiscus triporus TaxID=2934178 RepID=A0ABD3PBT0_9STRA